jgi:hypothetical protein
MMVPPPTHLERWRQLSVQADISHARIQVVVHPECNLTLVVAQKLEHPVDSSSSSSSSNAAAQAPQLERSWPACALGTCPAPTA